MIAVAAEDHDPRPLYVLVLEDAIRRALLELGVPDADYPAPVANAVEILTEALE